MSIEEMIRLMNDLEFEKGLTKELNKQLLAITQAINEVCSETEKQRIQEIIQKNNSFPFSFFQRICKNRSIEKRKN